MTLVNQRAETKPASAQPKEKTNMSAPGTSGCVTIMVRNPVKVYIAFFKRLAPQHDVAVGQK